MSDWSVYLIRCGQGQLYTGISNDVERRFEQHKQGRGAKFTRGRGPLHLEFFQEVGDRSLASRLEWRIKKLHRRDKERLIVGDLQLQELSISTDSQDLAEDEAQN